MALGILFLICRKTEVVCHEIIYKSDIILRNLERLRWHLVGRLIFHTQKEINMFKKYNGLSKRNKIFLRAHHDEFIIFNNITKDNAREELGISGDSPVFLCIGFIQRSKGFDRAIKVFQSINNDTAKMYIVGSIRTAPNENRHYLKELTDLASGNENIKIMEKYLTNEEFDTWITAADYVVIPYQEISSSGVAGRAKLFKKPVIASRVGGLENQMEDGDYLFESDDDLVGIFKHIIEKEEMEKSAKNGILYNGE